MFRHPRILAAVLVPLFCLTACIRTEERKEPRSKTALMISRASTGTTLQWKSREGERYTILYRDGKSPNARWQALPAATEVIGTGEMLVIQDTSPGAFHRSYMPQTLIAVPANSIRR